MTGPTHLLSRATLFRGWPDDGLERLTVLGHRRHFEPGEVLARQGKPNEWLHVITSGRVGLECEHPALEQPILLEEMGPGGVIGEDSLLDCRPPRRWCGRSRPSRRYGSPGWASP